MGLMAYSLASGSSGNSVLVRNGKTSVLIDAGIGIRRLAATLVELEIEPSDLSCILVTHEHSDHISGAVRMARRFGVPLVSTGGTLAAISGAEDLPRKALDVGEEMVLGSLLVRPFPISHDAACPVGYTIESNDARLCSVTDTGILTPEICTEASAADLLILESNHDVELLRTGPYPRFLKERISGDNGHLSNEAAAGFLSELARTGKRMSIWLAHLSEINNTPTLALLTAQNLLASQFHDTVTVEVAERDTPSLQWCSVCE